MGKTSMEAAEKLHRLTFQLACGQLNIRQTIALAIMAEIITDPEFPVGGIPAVDKRLCGEYGLTDKQACDVEYRLYAVFKKIRDKIKLEGE